MMRLPWRTSLVVALLLVTSVGTASAECAWVLWAETIEFDPSTLRPSGEITARHFNLTPIHAHETKPACDAMQAEFTETEKKRIASHPDRWTRSYS